jgi:ATP-binding cassette, subfamily B, bacterial
MTLRRVKSVPAPAPTEERAEAAGGSPTENGHRAGLSYLDLTPPSDRRSALRRVPRLAIDAFRLVWRASRRHLLTTLGLQVAAAVGIGLQLLVGRLVLVELISLSGRGGNAAALAPEFGLLILVTGALGTIGALVAHQQRLLVELVGRHTFDRIIDVSTAVDYRSFETPDFYDQLQRAKLSGFSRPIEMVNSLSTLTTSILTSFGLVGVLFVIEPLLLPPVVLAAVPVLLATLHNSRQSYAFEYAMTPESRERMYLMEVLTGRDTAKEVRVFGAGPFLRRRYDAWTEERLRRLREFLRRRLGVALLGTVAGSIGTGVAMGSLVVMLVNGRIGIASTVIAGVAMQQIGSRFNTITTSLGRLIESGMFIDDYNKFLELAPNGTTSTPNGTVRSQHQSRFKGLAIERASFSYPNTDAVVLDDVSLEIAPGEVVALVGENGSGKTTLVKLICQLYQPQTGRILWNGVDAATLPPEDVRADTTVIFQDFIQYHLSALDNVALGRVERAAELAAVERAARQAGAHDFVARLPQGYETRLGRQFYGGNELSIGQWQRLALARAFFRGGSFLVLDEPTASLDPKAEHQLFAQIRQLAEGRTVLLVSHRFSSVREADRIYVLEGGRITESGSHEELVARRGHYAELFELQAAAYLGETAKVTAPN